MGSSRSARCWMNGWAFGRWSSSGTILACIFKPIYNLEHCYGYRLVMLGEIGLHAIEFGLEIEFLASLLYY